MMWDYLLHPEQLVRTSLWKSLVAESGYMDKLKLIKLPSVKILGSGDEVSKGGKQVRKRRKGSPSKLCPGVSSDAMEIVEAEEAPAILPCFRRNGAFHLDELEGHFVTLKLREDACLHYDKRDFGGEEEKLLFSKDVIAMDNMGIEEVTSDLVRDALRSLQKSLYARRKLEDLVASQLSLEGEVRRLKDELKKERANAKASKAQAEASKVQAESTHVQVQEVMDGAVELVRKGIAQTKLVMMKQYEKGLHTSWRVKAQIAECIADLGEDASKILKSVEEEVGGDDSEGETSTSH